MADHSGKLMTDHHPGKAWCHRCSPDALMSVDELYQHLQDVHDLRISSRWGKVMHFVFLLFLLAVLALLLMTVGAVVIEWGH